LAVLSFFALGLAGCAPGGPREYSYAGSTMGTTYHVRVMADPKVTPVDGLEGEIAAALEDVNGRMSTYKPDSELSRFNQHLSLEPFAVSAETLAVFRISQEVSRESNGAFDITVGPLVNAFGFGPDERKEPTDAELAKLRERVGYQKVEIDPDGKLRKLRPDVYCDLSAVAKGYGVDKAAEAIEKRGIGRYMVEVGGEVRTKGLNAEGQPWRIGIEKPLADERAVERVVPLNNRSMATSGDYRNFYVENGKRLSHTIDPRTGRPIAHMLASVSVVHESCAWADAYATAIMVLGPEEGYQFAIDHQLAALLIVHNGEAFVEKATPAFEKIAEASHPAESRPANPFRVGS
jgi:thiamine biosynthesis lipoprotein